MQQKFIDTFETLKNYNDNSLLEVKQQRGRDFESLIADVLEDEKISVLNRSYHTSDNRSEQIDVAIELFHRIFLIEVKWVESNMAASELYAFLGKIENKFHGTLGIFISRIQLSKNFIDALNKGRRQSILVIHGEDIDELFKTNAPSFGAYLTYCFKLLSYNNVTHFPVKSYLPIFRAVLPTVTSTGISQGYVEFIKEVLHRETRSVDFVTAIEILSPDEVDGITDFIVRNFHKVWFSSLKDKSFYIPANYKHFLNLTKPSIDYLERTAGFFFDQQLITNPEQYTRDEFLDLFQPYYMQLKPVQKKHFENWLLSAFGKGFNDWDTENRLTEIVRRLWDSFAPEIRTGLSDYYLQFFLSVSRENKFAQKSYALELLNKGKISRGEIENWLVKKLSQVKQNYNGLMSPEAIQGITLTYHPLKTYMGISVDQWKAYIVEKLRNIKVKP